MRYFVIGNTAGGIQWVGRILEELTGLSVLEDSSLGAFGNSVVLEDHRFQSFAADSIHLLLGVSVENVTVLKDSVVHVSRNFQDCLCESLILDAPSDMELDEKINYTLEKHPYRLQPLMIDWYELNTKLYSENCLNVEYSDLCKDLHRVLKQLIDKFKLVVTKDTLGKVENFCSLSKIRNPLAQPDCGESLLDSQIKLKIKNIQKQLRRK